MPQDFCEICAEGHRLAASSPRVPNFELHLRQHSAVGTAGVGYLWNIRNHFQLVNSRKCSMA